VKPEVARVAVFLHDGSYDRMQQGLSIAASAVAVGRHADVFLFWWALERLMADRLDEPDFGPGREALGDRFEAQGMPTLRELLGHLRDSGLCTLYACSGTLKMLQGTTADLGTKVDQIVGWTTILTLTAGVSDRFYL
jgi:peroxiredoxin family protein